MLDMLRLAIPLEGLQIAMKAGCSVDYELKEVKTATEKKMHLSWQQ
jgi:hypothetical protein